MVPTAPGGPLVRPAEQPLVRVVDVLLSFLVGPPLLIDLYILFARGATTRGELLIAFAVGTVAGLSVLVRSSAPVVAVVVVSGASLVATWLVSVRGYPSYPETTAPVALCLLLVPVVRRWPPWVAALCVALSLGAMTVAVEARPTYQSWIVLPFLWVVVGSGIALGGYQRWLDWSRVQATESARQDERTALARELHDVVAHHVTGIVVQAQAARFVAGRDPEAAERALAAIESAGAEALASMRTMVGALRADADAPSAPTAGLGDVVGLVEQLRDGGHPVALELDPSLAPSLPDAVSGAAYRIVQEALTNVRRHAQPSASVTVRVVRLGAQLDVWVHNDGDSASARQRWIGGGGFGLVGMAERVAALGGTVTAGPSPGVVPGWDVRAILPIAHEGVPIGQGGRR